MPLTAKMGNSVHKYMQVWIQKWTVLSRHRYTAFLQCMYYAETFNVEPNTAEHMATSVTVQQLMLSTLCNAGHTKLTTVFKIYQLWFNKVLLHTVVPSSIQKISWAGTFSMPHHAISLRWFGLLNVVTSSFKRLLQYWKINFKNWMYHEGYKFYLRLIVPSRNPDGYGPWTHRLLVISVIPLPPGGPPWQQTTFLLHLK